MIRIFDLKKFLDFDGISKYDSNKNDIYYEHGTDFLVDPSVSLQTDNFVADPTYRLLTDGAGQQALYLQEANTTTSISVQDLNQGQIGDCFLISSIGEIALTNMSFISNMIHSNADGTETVTLYTDRTGHVPTAITSTLVATHVTVTNNFPIYAVSNDATQNVVAGVKEIWPQVLEAAFAVLGGGYTSIANGGSPLLAMEELTGKSASFVSGSQISTIINGASLKSLIDSKDMIVMDTAANNLTYNLVGHHAYMFEKMIGSGSSAMVQLGNPWGCDQPSLIPVSLLSKVFAEVDICHT